MAETVDVGTVDVEAVTVVAGAVVDVATGVVALDAGVVVEADGLVDVPDDDAVDDSRNKTSPFDRLSTLLRAVVDSDTCSPIVCRLNVDSTPPR